jgi:hypothetical protein
MLVSFWRHSTGELFLLPLSSWERGLGGEVAPCTVYSMRASPRRKLGAILISSRLALDWEVGCSAVLANTSPPLSPSPLESALALAQC